MQGKPKLLYLITKSSPFGGAQKYVYDLATSPEIHRDFDVAVALGGDGDLTRRLKQAGIGVIESKNLKNTLNPFTLLKIIFEMMRILKRENIKIVHLNSSIAGLAGSVAARLSNTKSIFTAHGWPSNENRPKIIKKIFKLLEIFLIKITNTNIAVSKQIIKDSNLDSKNFEQIYLGIDDIEHRAFDKHDKSKINILSIGELHPSKNHALAINAVKNINNNDINYHIFGEGVERKNLEERIESLGLQDIVYLHGNVVDAKNYVNSFDIFLMSSRTEALGYALMEATQSDAEIIISDAGGMKEVLEVTKNGEIFESENQKDLEEVLKKVIVRAKNKKQNTNATKLHLAKKQNHFPKSQMIEETMKIYKKLP